MTRALVAALLLLAAAPAAAADPIDLGPATLTLDDHWTGPAVTAPITTVVRTSGAAQLVVVRYEVPNLEAWRERTRGAHVDAIVAGFAATPGYRALGKPRVKRLGRGSVPTLELAFERRGPDGVELIAVRVLMFRTLTMAAVATAPDRAVAERAAWALAPD